MSSKNYLFFSFFLLSVASIAQNNKQNIRGTVIDKLSQTPIAGATIQMLGNAGIKSTTSDAKGNYLLSDISPDRYEIRVSFIGYNTQDIPNITVSAGKETILDIALEESFKKLKDVVVKSSNKAGTLNKFTTVSGRTFSMEEVNRYAGGRSDPARLAANFAGVSTPDDSRNDIVIRGNSPIGLLWKIDGMNVTNPNHFASVGTTGGAVSALNTNLLKSSDFLTSAFPAEYGNAISGVFDLGFRSGNTTKKETTLQMGVITGLEATTEGPFKKNSGASYLVGYRYSLAGIAQAAGINIGTSSTPSYQDISFKINSGSSSWGKFSLFGILATSSIAIEAGTASTLYGNGNQTDFASKIGILGLNHFKQLNSRSFLSTTFGLNYSSTNQTNYETDRSTNTTYSKEENNYAKTGYNFSTTFNTKINSRLFVKLGVQDELMGINLFYRTKPNTTAAFRQIWDKDTTTHLAQAFAEFKYNLSEQLTINGGLHAQELFLNNSTSLEPRLGLQYQLSPKSSLTAGYGLHAQMQPIYIYANGTGKASNYGLDFTKSNHYVVGYNLQPAKDWRVKMEIYYQSLYNVPVNSYASSYSILNTGSSYQTDTANNLVNTGTGKNYGAELTIEKFFSNGFYGLFTSSIYSSKYTASDGIERNTAFNGKYVYNLLAGKEWKVGTDHRNKISADIKFTNAGGRPYTPIDLTASQTAGRQVVKNDSYAYTSQYTDYFRLDLKLGYTFNSGVKKLSQSVSLDLQNVTNHQNVFSQSYDNGNKSIKTTYQLGLFPNLVYKLQF